MLLEHRVHPLAQRRLGALGREAEIEVHRHRARHHVARARPGMDIRDLEAGGRKALVALVPLRASELGQRRGEQMDRILDQMGIGDVPLDAAHRELRRKRAAPAVLQRIAERIDGARLADDAVVDGLVARLQPLHHSHGAVHRGAFLVGGQEEGDRARVARPLGDEALGGDDESGDRRLHVGRAAAVELAVAHGGDEGIRVPFGERAGRHHIGVAGKAHHGMPGAAARPEIRHLAELHRLAAKARLGQPRGEQLLAAAVFRGHRPAGNQLLGQLEGAGALRHSCRS